LPTAEVLSSSVVWAVIIMLMFVTRATYPIKFTISFRNLG
jgi:hypothetical protein